MGLHEEDWEKVDVLFDSLQAAFPDDDVSIEVRDLSVRFVMKGHSWWVSQTDIRKHSAPELFRIVESYIERRGRQRRTRPPGTPTMVDAAGFAMSAESLERMQAAFKKAADAMGRAAHLQLPHPVRAIAAASVMGQFMPRQIPHPPNDPVVSEEAGTVMPSFEPLRSEWFSRAIQLLSESRRSKGFEGTPIPMLEGPVHPDATVPDPAFLVEWPSASPTGLAKADYVPPKYTIDSMTGVPRPVVRPE